MFVRYLASICQQCDDNFVYWPRQGPLQRYHVQLTQLSISLTGVSELKWRQRLGKRCVLHWAADRLTRALQTFVTSDDWLCGFASSVDFRNMRDNDVYIVCRGSVIIVTHICEFKISWRDLFIWWIQLKWQWSTLRALPPRKVRVRYIEATLFCETMCNNHDVIQ